MAKKRKEKELIPMSQLHDELFRTREALDAAYIRFNYADDPELVEANIFAINALQSKYSYLLRCIKLRTGQPVSHYPEMKARIVEKAENTPEAVTAASQTEGGELCRW